MLDTISANIMEKLIMEGNCKAGNVTCTQFDDGKLATVQYVRAILETTTFMNPLKMWNVRRKIRYTVDEWVENNTSTGSLMAFHKVSIGVRDPMLLSIGLMLGMIIIELILLLINNKILWLAADIGYENKALIRSTRPCGAECKFDLPECTTRPDEIPCKTIVRFGAKDNHFGLSSNLQEPEDV